MAAAHPFHLRVVRADCWAPFFEDFAWLSPAAWASPAHPLRECVAASVSKALGYGIIAGSCAVKLPQAINVVRARSGAGLSLSSQYQELLSNFLAVLWHARWNDSPFSAYGETIIVTLGCALVIAAIWVFERPSSTHALGVIAAGAAMTALAASAPPALAGVLGVSVDTAKNALQLSSQLAFWGARATQIISTQRARTNGAQSPLSLAFNLAGSAARVFTSAREVKDPLQLAFSVFNVALNGTLLAQYVAFSGASTPKASATSTARGRSKAAAAAAAAVAVSGPEAASPPAARAPARKRK
jgi:mannose-P-dolichol utilization defect protein 1